MMANAGAASSKQQPDASREFDPAIFDYEEHFVVVILNRHMVRAWNFDAEYFYELLCVRVT